MEKFSVVGKSLPKTDGVRKATGNSIYGPDVNLPNMLFGKILVSPYPHARILKIDTSKAERLNGVKAVVTAKDTTLVKWGFMLKDQPLLAHDKVRFIGEPIAAAAAVDKEIAAEALDLIEVEYDELIPLFNPEEAMNNDAVLIHENVDTYMTNWPLIKYGNVCSHVKINRGDLEKGFSESDFLFEDRFTTPMQHQGYIEPHASTANMDPTGKITVFTPTQAPFMVRLELSETLGLPLNKIRVISTEVGAGFGGKTDILVEPLAVLLSQKSLCPVKIVLTRKEEFTISNPRHACIIELKTGVKRDGTINARKAKVIYDTGGYAGAGPGVASLGASYAVGPYRIPNIKIDAYSVYTNKINCGWMRAPGVLQVNFASESQMDIIADKIGIDPLEIRLKNALDENDTSATGQVLHSVGLKKTLKKAAELSNWDKRIKGKCTGRGISCTQYEMVGMPSGALIKVNEDGTIGLMIGAVDIGQGSSTVLSQIAAEELGLSLEDISIVSADTDITPFDAGTYGDRVTYNAGNAVKNAALDVKRQIIYMASKMLGAGEKELEIRDKMIYVKDTEKMLSFAELAMASYFYQGGVLLGRGSFFAEMPPYQTDTVEGHSFPSVPSHTYASQVADIKVNPKNGKIEVIKVYAVSDVGFAINPKGVEGQIEGAIVTGLGFALGEEMVEDNGMIVNPNFSDYRLPIITEIPEIKVAFIEEKTEEGPFGAKGAGNPPLVLPSSCIANALYDAVGIRIKELPLTQEKVFNAIKSVAFKDKQK
ncbi:MAG: xanthine dehydrogenase family protein molybdopterin-binding subunit [Thermodesulfobacteriota bacterium]|nr:xanthine dehydrogenase family protein molybdopterin-binding subunit [Thermodesulfobacteriota bacterium]